MKKFSSPLKEVEHSIGVLYETVLQSNIRLTGSVNNLKVTVENLMAAEVKVKDIVMAQKEIEQKYKLLANS
jgi:hypothetical protein